EVVERANSLPYGLAAYAFTSSNTTAAAIGDAIASGMVGVNSVAVSTPETPFGGVKESRHGSEGGVGGLGADPNTKFISQAQPAAAFELPLGLMLRSIAAQAPPLIPAQAGIQSYRTRSPLSRGRAEQRFYFRCACRHACQIFSAVAGMSRCAPAPPGM